MDIGKRKDDYVFYEGYEGEKEIIISLPDIAYHIWDGYFDDIFGNPQSTENGWIGFTRDYNEFINAFEEECGSGMMIKNNCTFGEALDAIKNGERAKRDGWNGKKQYIQLGFVHEFVTLNGYRHHYHEEMGNKVIVFHGTQGTQVGWLASQADMLAEDWIIMEGK